MIKEPMQAIEWDVSIDALVNIEGVSDCLVIGGVQAEWPAVFNEMPHHSFEFVFHYRRDFRLRLEEVFKVRCRVYKHLTGTVGAIIVIALTWLHRASPALKIGEFLLRFLGKEVVGEPHVSAGAKLGHSAPRKRCSAAE